MGEISYKIFIPKKKGQLTKLDDGAEGLMNEEGKRYRVNKQIIEIWNKCDGTKNTTQLERDFPLINSILPQLQKLELVELIPTEGT